MKIYVGRWDLLPDSWEGVNGLNDADQDTIREELVREIEEYDKTHTVTDNRVGVYRPEEFEAEFNYDARGRFSTETYWIKIF